MVTNGPVPPGETSQLKSSLHCAQAQGLLRTPETIRQLLAGIAHALTHTVERNAADPKTAWALQSETYWDHFEMEIKEALLVPFVGLDPTLGGAVRHLIDATLRDLKRKHQFS